MDRIVRIYVGLFVQDVNLKQSVEYGSMLEVHSVSPQVPRWAEELISEIGSLISLQTFFQSITVAAVCFSKQFVLTMPYLLRLTHALFNHRKC